MTLSRLGEHKFLTYFADLFWRAAGLVCDQALTAVRVK
jgi:hypothetical protein